MLPGGILTPESEWCVQGPDRRRGREGRIWLRIKVVQVLRVASVEPSSMRSISQPLREGLAEGVLDLRDRAEPLGVSVVSFEDLTVVPYSVSR